jgi:hypothetical protein
MIESPPLRELGLSTEHDASRRFAAALRKVLRKVFDEHPSDIG